MPQDKAFINLKTEISKIAKLSRIQSGLPGAMRAVPVVAIIVGGALGKVPGAPDLEKVMLGRDEFIALQAPGEGKPDTENNGSEDLGKKT